MNKIHHGDCLDVLGILPDQTFHTCITSPPYWGLRDYGVDGQLGLEKTPEEYVAKMVSVFREVRRVLRDDGTLWLNLGDSYNGTGKKNGQTDAIPKQKTNHGACKQESKKDPTLKPKDLVGIPWRVAFALQLDGWYLRQDIIWAKPNPMPESVRDRCTKAHEYIFLLSKSERYHFDSKAISEPAKTAAEAKWAGTEFGLKTGVSYAGTGTSTRRFGRAGNKQRTNSSVRGLPPNGVASGVPWEGLTRNRRSVWTVTPKPFKGAHFAVFPPELIEPCVLAGCPVGGMVLDPFFGSGTTGMVAHKHGRAFVGIELNKEYIQMAERRIASVQPFLTHTTAGGA